MSDINVIKRRPTPKGEKPYTQEEADKTRENFSTAISYITFEDATQKPAKPEHVFYTHFIQALRYTETQDTRIAAVQFEPNSPTGKFLINPRNTNGLGLKAFSGLVVHELLHIVFGHVHLQTEERMRYPKHCNVAMDMAINQIVLKDGYGLPWGKGVFPDFPDKEMAPCLPQTVTDRINKKFGLNIQPPPADESYEFYLQWLFEMLEYAQQQQQNGGGGKGKPQQQDCPSCGGSGKGKPDPNQKGEGGGGSSDQDDQDGDEDEQDDKKGKGKKGKSGKGDDQDQDGSGEGDDQEDEQDGNEDGEGDGDDTDDEHDHGGDEECDCPDCDGTGKQPQGRDLVDDLLDELDEMTGHEEWEAAEEEMTDDQKELVQRFVAQAAQEAANSSGGVSNLPGHVQAAYANLVKVLEPKMDWSQKIREFAGGCGRLTPFIRTMRENKHGFPGLFTFKPGGAVGLVVDTSGSVSEAEFGLFMAEAVAISRDYDMEVFVLETSYGPTDEIWSISEEGVQDMYKRVGYGGTNMKPGVMQFLELLEERDERVQVGGIIVLSDGELGMDSLVKPEECDVPLLWAFSRDVQPFGNHRFAGEIMYFDPHHKGRARW